MSERLPFLPVVLALLAVIIPAMQVVAAGHVLLKRRDVRSSVGWMGLIWLAPVVGVILYWMFGVNRIRRRARALRPERADYGKWIPTAEGHAEPLEQLLGDRWRHLRRHVPLVDRVTRRPLLSGCSVEPLVDGTEAYPAMLEAIRGARSSVTLLSYIFDADRVGKQFRDALGDAVERGVEVRVLIDAVGARYSVPPITRSLRAMGVRTARFMPGWVPWRARYVNLRNHRKILVVDGSVAFTGGLNIREEFWHVPEGDGHFAHDLHFRVRGPVVAEIQEVFAEDWTFTTGERLDGELWFPPLTAAGSSLARGISDGPDIDHEKLQLTILGALSVARSSVRIITPYFLPDLQLISALQVTALRGIEVEVIVPSKNNQKLVQWASNGQLDQLLERGVRVYASPEPFDHSKLMVVDVCYVLIGSANWDPRSLQLNFEFNVEVFDPDMGARMNRLFEERRDRAREITLEQIRSRSLPVRIRDGVARLMSPYL